MTDLRNRRISACTRRDALGALLGLGVTYRAAAADTPDRGRPLSAWSTGETGHEAFGAGSLDGRGIALYERAHQILRDPCNPRTAFGIARRPGEWLWRLDLERETVAHAIALDDSRRFEGHALLLPGAAGASAVALLTTETDTDHGAGIVGLRDPHSLDLLDEWSTHGIGPHELIYWSTANVVVVANGGVLTLPETGRENRAEGKLRSSLAAINPANGEIARLWNAPAPGLSLRHLAVAEDGVLGVAMQELPEPPAGGTGPVLALLPTPEGELYCPEATGQSTAQWRGYAGAIAAYGRQFAVTCPRAGMVAVWSSSGVLAAQIRIPGAWGIAAHDCGWWVSNSLGDIYSIHAARREATLLFNSPGKHWDNHLGA